MLIGITGTNGSGKGTVVEYLKTKGFTHYSARSVFIKEVERQGLPIDRDTIVAVANELRSKFGPAYIVETLLIKALADGGDAVIESIRTVGEAQSLKEAGGVLVAVDAEPRLRYDRVLLRGSETDHIDFDTFIAQEQRELRSDDPTRQNILGVVALADFKVTNNGSRELLGKEIEHVLTECSKE